MVTVEAAPGGRGATLHTFPSPRKRKLTKLHSLAYKCTPPSSPHCITGSCSDSGKWIGNEKKMRCGTFCRAAGDLLDRHTASPHRGMDVPLCARGAERKDKEEMARQKGHAHSTPKSQQPCTPVQSHGGPLAAVVVARRVWRHP